MRLLREVSVQTKIVTVVVAVSMVSGLAIALYLPDRLQDESMRALESKGISIAEMLAYNLTAIMEFGDETSAREAMVSALRDRDVTAVEIFDQFGQPWMRATPPLAVPEGVVAGRRTHTLRDPRALYVATPLSLIHI